MFLYQTQSHVTPPSPSTQEEHAKGVKNIIEEAALFENPEEVKEQQHLREETLKAASRISEHDI